MGSTRVSALGQLLNLLSSILTILLTCPNNNTLLCYSNEPFLTVQTFLRTTVSTQPCDAVYTAKVHVHTDKQRIPQFLPKLFGEDGRGGTTGL